MSWWQWNCVLLMLDSSRSIARPDTNILIMFHQDFTTSSSIHLYSKCWRKISLVQQPKKKYTTSLIHVQLIAFWASGPCQRQKLFQWSSSRAADSCDVVNCHMLWYSLRKVKRLHTFVLVMAEWERGDVGWVMCDINDAIHGEVWRRACNLRESSWAAQFSHTLHWNWFFIFNFRGQIRAELHNNGLLWRVKCHYLYERKMSFVCPRQTHSITQLG